MSDTAIPDYLYHYTNINTLALILQNKTLRLNCLVNVDDLNEGQSKDLGKIGRYFFVSSWTDREDESIPFWAMYTDKMRGVRIKLPSNPFRLHDIPSVNRPDLTINLPPSIHRPEVLFDKDYLFSTSNDILKKVQYTNDENLLFPQISEQNPTGEFKANFSLIGMYKRKEWEFQSEWRYLTYAFPYGLKDFIQFKSDMGQIMVNALKLQKPLSIFSYYLDFDEEKIKDMEVVLGPGTTEGDKIIVHSLIRSFNPDAIIKESCLKGTIRC